MSKHAALIAKLRQQRESWVTVEPGVRLLVRRPAEAEQAAFREGFSVELLCKHVVGWEGVTEALLLGPAIGASDPLAFDAELVAEVAADHVAWFEPVSVELARLIGEHWKAREATAKN